MTSRPSHDASGARVFLRDLRLGMASVDAAGVLFFPELFRLAHEADEAWMRAIGYPLHEVLGERPWVLPVVHAEADYLRPMRHGDEFSVRLTLARIGGASYTLAVDFVDDEGNSSARARVVHACVERRSGRSVPLDPVLRDALVPYLAD